MKKLQTLKFRQKEPFINFVDTLGTWVGFAEVFTNCSEQRKSKKNLSSAVVAIDFPELIVYELSLNRMGCPFLTLFKSP